MRLIATSDRGVLAVLKGSGAGVSIVDEAGQHVVVAPDSGAGSIFDARRVFVSHASPAWNAEGASYTLQAIDRATRVIQNLAPAGNETAAGGGRFMTYTPGAGLHWNYPASAPDGHAVGDIDPDSGVAATLVQNRGGHDVVIWNPAGAEIGRLSFGSGVVYVCCRADLVVAVAADQSMQTARVLGDEIVGLTSPAVLMPYVAPVPVDVAGALWVVYATWGPTLVDALVAHPWLDASRGVVIARDLTAWGYDAIAVAGALVAGWCTGAGEHPGEGRLARVEVGALVDLRAALTPPLPLVAIGRFSHPLWVAPFKAWNDRPDYGHHDVPTNAEVLETLHPEEVPGDKYFVGDRCPGLDDPVWGGPPVVPQDRFIGHFASLEGGGTNADVLAAFRRDLPIVKADCVRRGRPLYLTLEVDWTGDTDEGRGLALVDECLQPQPGLEIVPMIELYPFKVDGLVPSNADVRAAWVKQIDAARSRASRLAFATSLYTQSGNYPLADILRLQNVMADLVRTYRPILVAPFSVGRPSGVVSYPDALGPVLQQWAAACPGAVPAFLELDAPPVPSEPFPPSEDPMPYSRDDLVAFAFGNGYLQLIDFTRTHPDFRSITNDRDRVMAAGRWVLDEWDRTVAHPDAEGYGTALRQWVSGESFRHLATRMQLELRPGVAPEL